MKVLAILIVAVSSASARGSGPYLPSGWRPDGPAFFLPNEVKTKPSENPLKETLFQESEASGSDFLREYGPPKVQEVSQDITQQGLPDIVTEQVFAAIQAKISQEVVNEEITETIVTEKDVSTVDQEAITVTEQISTISDVLATATEAVTEEDTATEVVTEENLTTEQATEELQGRAIKLEIEASVADTTDGFIEAAVVTESDVVVTQQQDIVSDVEQRTEQNAKIEHGIEFNTAVEQRTEQNLEQNVKVEPETEVNTAVEQITEEGNVNIQQDIAKSEVKSAVEGTLEENVEQTVKILEEGVKNIAQEIVKIESEVVQEQNVGVSGLKSIQVSGSLEQFPEGFLEYGPPGFREYGPPKGDELLRSSAVQEKSESELIENNETRRRRFSPKFRPVKKH